MTSKPRANRASALIGAEPPPNDFTKNFLNDENTESILKEPEEAEGKTQKDEKESHSFLPSGLRKMTDVVSSRFLGPSLTQDTQPIELRKNSSQPINSDSFIQMKLGNQKIEVGPPKLQHITRQNTGMLWERVNNIINNSQNDFEEETEMEKASSISSGTDLSKTINIPRDQVSKKISKSNYLKIGFSDNTQLIVGKNRERDSGISAMKEMKNYVAQFTKIEPESISNDINPFNLPIQKFEAVNENKNKNMEKYEEIPQNQPEIIIRNCPICERAVSKNSETNECLICSLIRAELINNDSNLKTENINNFQNHKNSFHIWRNSSESKNQGRKSTENVWKNLKKNFEKKSDKQEKTAIIFPDPPSTKLPKNISDRKLREKLINILENYLEKLYSTHETVFLTKIHLETSISELLLDFTTKAVAYSAYASKPLLQDFRELHHYKLAAINTRIEIEDIKATILYQKRKSMRSVIEKIKSNAICFQYYYDLIIPTKKLLTSLAIKEKKQQLQILHQAEEKVSLELKKKLTEEKRILPDQRSLQLSNLLSKIELQDEFFYDFDIQDEFNLLIRDQRYKEGSRIRHLEQTLLNSSNFDIEELEDYVQRFINTIFEEHKSIKSNAINFIKLELMMQRMIFKNFFPTLCVKNPNCDLYYKNVLFLRSRIKDHFETPIECTITDNPNWVALPIIEISQAIEQIAFEYTPQDMAQCIRSALQLLSFHCKKVMNLEISADDLLPTLIWILVFTNIPNMPSFVDYMKNFLFNSDRMGSFGYCVVTLEASVEWILRYEG